MAMEVLPHVTMVDDYGGIEHLSQTVNAVLDTQIQVACSFESVLRGRYGRLQIVSLCFADHPSTPYRRFLVEVGRGAQGRERMQVLKPLFESNIVEKVIHDCRFDSDCLFHNHDVCLTHVHDTNRYHHVISPTKSDNVKLEYVLKGCGFQSALRREFKDRSDRIPDESMFWAKRPLNDLMLTVAFSRVEYLLMIAAVQKGKLLLPRKHQKAQQLSEDFANRFRCMKVASFLRLEHPATTKRDVFWGKYGEQIRNLIRPTGAYIFKGTADAKFWVLYYHDDDDLLLVMRCMGYPIDPE
jgi:hypothetical protein